jgi:hypothetical protein
MTDIEKKAYTSKILKIPNTEINFVDSPPISASTIKENHITYFLCKVEALYDKGTPISVIHEKINYLNRMNNFFGFCYYYNQELYKAIFKTTEYIDKPSRYKNLCNVFLEKILDEDTAFIHPIKTPEMLLSVSLNFLKLKDVEII